MQHYIYVVSNSTRYKYEMNYSKPEIYEVNNGMYYINIVSNST
jgi:hypothetical protein